MVVLNRHKAGPIITYPPTCIPPTLTQPWCVGGKLLSRFAIRLIPLTQHPAPPLSCCFQPPPSPPATSPVQQYNLYTTCCQPNPPPSPSLPPMLPLYLPRPGASNINCKYIDSDVSNFLSCSIDDVLIYVIHRSGNVVAPWWMLPVRELATSTGLLYFN
jgi:hypothetical protein